MKTINPNIRPYIIALAILLGVALLLFMGGCNPLRHYEKVAADYPRSQQKREMLAPVCLVEFPPNIRTDSFVTTKTVIEKDTSASSELRQRIDELAAELQKRPDCPQINRDSLYEAIKAKIKPEVHTTIIESNVKSSGIDSAGIVVLQTQLRQRDIDYNKQVIENNSLKQKNQNLEQENKDLAKWRLWFWIVLVFGVIGIAGAIKFF